MKTLILEVSDWRAHPDAAGARPPAAGARAARPRVPVPPQPHPSKKTNPPENESSTTDEHQMTTDKKWPTGRTSVHPVRQAAETGFHPCLSRTPKWGSTPPSGGAGCALASGPGARTEVTKTPPAFVPHRFSAGARKTAPAGGCVPHPASEVGFIGVHPGFPTSTRRQTKTAARGRDAAACHPSRVPTASSPAKCTAPRNTDACVSDPSATPTAPAAAPRPDRLLVGNMPSERGCPPAQVRPHNVQVRLAWCANGSLNGESKTTGCPSTPCRSPS